MSPALAELVAASLRTATKAQQRLAAEAWLRSLSGTERRELRLWG